MGGITPEEIRKHLNDVLSSPDFANSQRIKDFLKYIVEASLTGKAETLKAYTIAVEVFSLGSNFDSRLNPLVRTEARRLRSKLDHYYLENPQSPVRISIPKGGYAATFSRSPAVYGQGAFSDPENARPEQLPAKGTLLILPFNNISSDLETEKFSSALLKEISYRLSKFYDLNVIDFQFPSLLAARPTEEELRPLIEKHKARFLLGGSIQLERKQLRMWAVLRDSTTLYNIWSEKFDCDLNKISTFQLQDEIAEAIIYKIAGEFGVINHTLIKEYTAIQKADSITDEAAILYSAWVNLLSDDSFRMALKAVEGAVASLPDNANLLAMLADLYASDYQLYYNLVEQNLEKSMAAVTKALLLAPQNQLALQTMALNHYLRNNKEKFIESAEKAVSVNPIGSNTLTALGNWYGYLGMWDRALELTKKVQDINPSTPFWCHTTWSMYFYIMEDYQASLDWAYKINMPETSRDPLFKLVAAAQLGLKEETAQIWDTLMTRFPFYREHRLEVLRQMIPREEYVQKLEEGFKKAEILLGIDQAGIQREAE